MTPPSIIPFLFHSFYDDRYDGLDPKFRLECVGGFPIRIRTHGAELSCSLFNGWSLSFCVSIALTFKFHDPSLFAEFATEPLLFIFIIIFETYGHLGWFVVPHTS